jgi:hypothetical protein
MSTIARSPGPWTVDKSSFPILVIDTNEMVVAEFHTDGEAQGEAAIANEQQTIADATASGALPDLLEALQTAAAALDVARTGCACSVAHRASGHHIDCYVPTVKEAIDKVTAAIAKATS